jgi:hypothetical protein
MDEAMERAAPVMMKDHWLSTDRHYVVPPANLVRVVVSEHGSNVYTAVEDLIDSGVLSEGQRVRSWAHRPGSTEGHGGSLHAAMLRAEERWRRLRMEGAE